MITLEEFTAMQPEGSDVLQLAISCHPDLDPDDVAAEAASAVRRAYVTRFGGAE